jgi:hypothetical protein
MFIRRRRSEDRMVTVEGTLLRILFVGVSNPHAAFALMKELSPFRDNTGVDRTGVNLSFLPVLLDAIPFRGDTTFAAAGPTLFLRLADPGVPTMTQFATMAAVVTRASAPDGLRCRSLK